MPTYPTIPVSGASLAAADLAHLGHAAELGMIAKLAEWPRLVDIAARGAEPHRVAFYLYDLAGALHSYWNLGNDRPEKRFIVEQDAALTAARLFLGAAIGQVIRNGLAVLGVEAVESM